MLRRFAYNKILRTTGMLILLILLLLFPAKKTYDLKDEYVKKVSSNEKIEIYLLDKNDYVARCQIPFSSSDDTTYAKTLIEFMKINGMYEDKVPNGFKSVLPEDLKVLNVEIKDSDITANLSKEFYDIPKKYLDKSLELITYNLTTIKNVKNVYLLIEGKEIDGVKLPLTRKNGVNLKYEETNFINTSLVTVYYLSKNNKKTYYVPVSKVKNDQREKIEIIIDELKSNSIYQTNLMSFLNYNTKLTNYNIDNDIMYLNFNEYIFDDIEAKNILEEVVYSITASVFDNYDVKQVVISVNDEEIVKSVSKNIE